MLAFQNFAESPDTGYSEQQRAAAMKVFAPEDKIDEVAKIFRDMLFVAALNDVKMCIDKIRGLVNFPDPESMAALCVVNRWPAPRINDTTKMTFEKLNERLFKHARDEFWKRASDNLSLTNEGYKWRLQFDADQGRQRGTATAIDYIMSTG